MQRLKQMLLLLLLLLQAWKKAQRSISLSAKIKVRIGECVKGSIRALELGGNELLPTVACFAEF